MGREGEREGRERLKGWELSSTVLNVFLPASTNLCQKSGNKDNAKTKTSLTIIKIYMTKFLFAALYN